ncbi:hypothetical protein [Bacillus alveayuensis]|nr:hypothetical protein [Bacillus alveayuensis]
MSKRLLLYHSFSTVQASDTFAWTVEKQLSLRKQPKEMNEHV